MPRRRRYGSSGRLQRSWAQSGMAQRGHRARQESGESPGESYHRPSGVEGPPGPPGAPGEAGDPHRAKLVRRENRGQPARRAIPGPPGKFMPPKAWSRGVHYEAALVTHAGSTWCAARDTAEAPPHEDWICVAAAGANGADGRSFTIRGTWNPRSDIARSMW